VRGGKFYGRPGDGCEHSVVRAGVDPADHCFDLSSEIIPGSRSPATETARTARWISDADAAGAIVEDEVNPNAAKDLEHVLGSCGRRRCKTIGAGCCDGDSSLGISAAGPRMIGLPSPTVGRPRGDDVRESAALVRHKGQRTRPEGGARSSAKCSIEARVLRKSRLKGR